MISKNDKKLIICIIILAAVILAVGQFTQKEGAYAVVYVDTKEIARYPLDENITVDIEGYDGGYNTLVIKDGKAYLSDADCPDGLCVGMGEIAYNGQSVVCLPHKVVIEIESDDKSEISGDAVDVIAR